MHAVMVASSIRIASGVPAGAEGEVGVFGYDDDAWGAMGCDDEPWGAMGCDDECIGFGCNRRVRVDGVQDELNVPAATIPVAIAPCMTTGGMTSGNMGRNIERVVTVRKTAI